LPSLWSRTVQWLASPFRNAIFILVALHLDFRILFSPWLDLFPLRYAPSNFSRLLFTPSFAWTFVGVARYTPFETRSLSFFAWLLVSSAQEQDSNLLPQT
jgi:hypothetical protein